MGCIKVSRAETVLTKYFGGSASVPCMSLPWWWYIVCGHAGWILSSADLGEELPERKRLMDTLTISISRCILPQLLGETRCPPRAAECPGIHAAEMRQDSMLSQLPWEKETGLNILLDCKKKVPLSLKARWSHTVLLYYSLAARSVLYSPARRTAKNVHWGFTPQI